MTQENLPLFVYGTLKRGESRRRKMAVSTREGYLGDDARGAL